MSICSNFKGFCSYPMGGYITLLLMISTLCCMGTTIYSVVTCQFVILEYTSNTGTFEQTYTNNNYYTDEDITAYNSNNSTNTNTVMTNTYTTSIGLFQWLRPTPNISSRSNVPQTYNNTDSTTITSTSSVSSDQLLNEDNWKIGTCVGYQQSMLTVLQNNNSSNNKNFDVSRIFGIVSVLVSVMVSIWIVSTGCCIEWNYIQLVLLKILYIVGLLSTIIIPITFYQSSICTNNSNQMFITSKCTIGNGGLIMISSSILWLLSLLICIFYLQPISDSNPSASSNNKTRSSKSKSRSTYEPNSNDQQEKKQSFFDSLASIPYISKKLQQKQQQEQVIVARGKQVPPTAISVHNSRDEIDCIDHENDVTNKSSSVKSFISSFRQQRQKNVQQTTKQQLLATTRTKSIDEIDNKVESSKPMLHSYSFDSQNDWQKPIPINHKSRSQSQSQSRSRSRSGISNTNSKQQQVQRTRSKSYDGSINKHNNHNNKNNNSNKTNPSFIQVRDNYISQQQPSLASSSLTSSYYYNDTTKSTTTASNSSSKANDNIEITQHQHNRSFSYGGQAILHDLSFSQHMRNIQQSNDIHTINDVKSRSLHNRNSKNVNSNSNSNSNSRAVVVDDITDDEAMEVYINERLNRIDSMISSEV